jgi:hypothetical protein
MTEIAISIFITQTGDKVSVKSLSADDWMSKAIERMLCEQATHVIGFLDATFVCADEIKKGST